MKLIAKLVMAAAILVSGQLAAYAQLTEVKGAVVSSDGTGPVVGATVYQADNTTNGTVTDADGRFSISVASDAELTVSSIGYRTVTVPASKAQNIILEPDFELLDEIVVTGYTVQRKADLTGSVSVVNVDDIAKQNENNPIKALQGRVPGMNITADGGPSGAATIRIRGIGTLNDNDPLFIIDGVPTKAGMHELNGNDIESIQVLKDASSASSTDREQRTVSSSLPPRRVRKDRSR